MSRLKLAVLAGTAWMCVAAVIFFLLGSINLCMLVTIARDPEPAEATVTRTDCNNHASVYYSYQVIQHTFNGRDSMGARCSVVKTGDEIQIHYARSQPTLSEAHDPVGTVINELVTIGLVAFFFPPLAIAIVRFRIRRMRVYSIPSL